MKSSAHARRSNFASWVGILLILPAPPILADAIATTSEGPTVGISMTIDEVILPGSELEAKPITDYQQPIVLRVTQAFRHGTAFRYQFDYYGLEPGEFNLVDYLQRKDGSSTADLPQVLVRVNGVLPPGQIQPSALPARKSAWIGGYRLLLILGGIVWIVGLVLLIRINRRGPAAHQTNQQRTSLSLADRLRPLVEAAADGSISVPQRAELERLLLAYWRKKLKVEDLPPGKAMVALRADPTAGGLLEQLDAWLHDPHPNSHLDVAALLAPYRNVEMNDVAVPG